MTIKRDSSIAVYTKPGCVQCTMTTRYLDDRGVEYQVLDVTEDAAAPRLPGRTRHSRRRGTLGRIPARQAPAAQLIQKLVRDLAREYYC